jgi:hypothetical protein
MVSTNKTCVGLEQAFGFNRKGQIVKTHFALKCEALVPILPPNEYKNRTSDDDKFVHNVRHQALAAMLRGGQKTKPKKRLEGNCSQHKKSNSGRIESELVISISHEFIADYRKTGFIGSFDNYILGFTHTAANGECIFPSFSMRPSLIIRKEWLVVWLYSDIWSNKVI